MLSPKLIHLIEYHWDEILARSIRSIRCDPDLPHLKDLSQAELRDLGRNILEKMGHWLADAKDEEVARAYESMGRLRFEEDVPLHEVVRGLCLLKSKAMEYLEEQGLAKTSLELYAEGEFEHRLGRFFDLMLYHVVRGYEAALRRAASRVA